MRSSSHEKQGYVVGQLINQEPVTSEMAFPKSIPVSSQGMISKARRKIFVVCQYLDGVG